MLGRSLSDCQENRGICLDLDLLHAYIECNVPANSARDCIHTHINEHSPYYMDILSTRSPRS